MSGVDSISALKYQWMMWRLIGLHPLDKDVRWSPSYRLYSFVINCLNNIFTPVSLYVECLRSDSLAEFCESFYLAAVLIVQQLKLINLFRVRDDLGRAHRILRKLDARLDSEQERQIIRDRIVESQRVSLGVFIFFLIVLSTGLFNALFSAGNHLIFSASFPWNWEQSQRAFQLTFLFQFVSSVIYTPLSANSDTYPLVYLNLVAGHCKALALRIARLGHSRHSREYHHQQLIACAESHQIILQLMSTMQNSLSMACFVQLGCTAVSLCTISFCVAIIKIGLLGMFYMVLMMLSILVETLIICYASDQVIQAGEEITHAFYATNWIDQPVAFRRCLVLMLMRSQRPLGIVAGKIMHVRMTTLLAVIKLAYSMFTLLNEVNK